MKPYGSVKNRRDVTSKWGNGIRCCDRRTYVSLIAKKKQSRIQRRRARRIGKIFSYE